MSLQAPILQVENLSKRYCMNLHRSLHYAMRDIIGSLLPVRGPLTEPTLRKDEFWALRDVNFNLKRGGSLGVLGRNGSGKSTLLKIISGTLKPTTGTVTIRGRLRLLALGAGFNPILSGRENIMIACSLLGFDRATSMAKYEEIVDFSELGKFIESPVKTYSSGMYSRLGFAIAIHTDPDLLLVDEALAVGDLPFVSKCLRRIHEYRSAGGSLVLVSHTGYTVRQNCDQAIWLQSGLLKTNGSADSVVTEYEMHLAEQNAGNDDAIAASSQVSYPVQSVEVECPKEVISGAPMTVSVRVHTLKPLEKGAVSLTFVDANNTVLFYTLPDESDLKLGLHTGTNTWHFQYARIPLIRGAYRINVVVFDGNYENQFATHYFASRFNIVMASEKLTAGIFTVDSTITKE